MEQPNYILRFNEAVLVPVNKSVWPRVLKISVWVIVGIIIIGSFIFHDNLFSEISWTARILLIMLAVATLFVGNKREYTPSPMELRFYDDALVMYQPERYYERNYSRRTTNTLKYSDITKCVYKARSKRMQIYGNGTAVWYKYRKDGTLPTEPTTVRPFTDGMIYFSTRCAEAIDFKQEIETHSPLKVIIEDD